MMHSIEYSSHLLKEFTDRENALAIFFVEQQVLKVSLFHVQVYCF